MAWGRFGNGPLGDDQPIEFWMDDQGDQVAQRDALTAAGRDLWNASTRSGENLEARRPTDVAALGRAPGAASSSSTGGEADAGPSGRSGGVDGETPAAVASAPSPSVRYVKASAGDNITRLVGGGDPGAIGAFARLNGMDGRNSTIYAGRVYAIPAADHIASADDTTLGRRLLQHDSARVAAIRAQRAANDQFQARFNAGENLWTGMPVSGGPAFVRRSRQTAPPAPSQTHWYDNALLEIPAGAGAFGGGLVFGSLVRGPVRTGQFIGDTLDFAKRWLDPNHDEYHPLNSARDQVREFENGVADLARWAAKNPAGAAKLGAHELHEFRMAHDPTSVPIAPTTAEEMHDQFEIGANDGEFLTPLQIIQRAKGAVELMQGGAEAVRAARYAKKIKPREYKRLIERGDTPEMADYLSDPYPETAMGSHFKARSSKLPDELFGMPLPPSIAGQPWPRWYIESRANVNKFEGMSRDQAYTGHYGYGAGFYGARLPAHVNGGKGWSGRQRGARRYGRVERIVRGAPPALKKAAAGAGAVGGLTAYDLYAGDRPE